MSFEGIVTGLLDFTFYYPLFMSYVWATGALYYFFYREQSDHRRPEDPPPLQSTPPVSFLVPCHNEGDNAEESIRSILNQDYPEFEIVAINDASSDDTGERLDALAAREPRLRVIHFEKNQGKAMGLRIAALASRHEFVICLDGDALLDRFATRWIVRHFTEGARVGAVTGNPRVRNRTTLLGKIQVGEFSSIIGLIKRAQRIYGRVFTVSGVVAAFRKAALHDVNYWNVDMVTEDIDVSWRLQLAHWDIRYEPNALCWILMPETFSGLWRQRLRWAQGGIEVFQRYFRLMTKWHSRRMWFVGLELAVSTFWAYMIGFVFLLWILGLFIELPDYMNISSVLPGWGGIILGATCLIQFGVSLAIDSRYEPALSRYYYWMIWYPMLYWLIHSTATVVAVPKALLKTRGSRAIWVSPDRGIRPRRKGSEHG
ncbi:MAG: poly-beta-1,6-N-acetyl-D-glucosamine synthase [Gammaproteobacteria bacterium]|jgi:biofilm PGA synthesis N-glycosyltransferase PgaC